MNNPLFNIASQNSLIVIDPKTLLDYMHQDRIATYNEGFLMGVSSLSMMSKKEAAAFLGVAEGTIDNLRRRGELRSHEYCGTVHFKREDLRKYVDKHANTYVRIHSK